MLPRNLKKIIASALDDIESGPIDEVQLFESGVHFRLREMLTELSPASFSFRIRFATTIAHLARHKDNKVPLQVEKFHLTLMQLMAPFDTPIEAKSLTQWIAAALANLADSPANHVPLRQAGCHIFLKNLIDDETTTQETKVYAALAISRMASHTDNLEPLREDVSF